MPRGYEDGVAGFHGFGTPDRTCLQGIRSGLQDLTGSDTRSYMPRRYQVGATGSHGLGTPDRTCLEGIRTELQDLKGSEHQIVHV